MIVLTIVALPAKRDEIPTFRCWSYRQIYMMDIQLFVRRRNKEKQPRPSRSKHQTAALSRTLAGNDWRAAR